MLNWVIDFSLRHRAVVILTALGFGVLGVVSLVHLDIDAFPDTTPVQIQINTIAPSLAPEEVERRVTFPVEQALSGLPGLEKLRSISKFGMSQVVVTFDDGILEHYDTADALQGYIEVTDRRGERHAFPICSLSMGVATTENKPLASEWEASSVASEMKEVAKRTAGTNYQVDRRT